MFGFRICGISKKGFEQVRFAHMEYYNKITEIQKTETTPFDYAINLNIQAVILNEEEDSKND